MRQLLFLFLFGIISFYSFAQTNKGEEKRIIAQRQILEYISSYDDSITSSGEADIKLLKKALKESQSIHFDDGIQKASERYASEYIRKEDYSNAIKMLDLSIRSIDTVAYPKQYAGLLSQKGNVFQFQKKYEPSIALYTHALDIYKKLSDKIEIANTHINIGNTYFKQGETEKSEYHLILASKTFVQIKGIKNKKIAPALKNLAEAYDEQGNFKEALTLLNQSLELYKNQKDHEGIASTLVSIGNIQYQLKDFEAATKSYNEAIGVSKKHNLNVSMLESYQGLSNIKSAKQEYDSAFQLYNKYMEIKDTIYEETKNKTLQELKSILELRIKNQQIDILNTKNELSKIQTEKQRTYTYGMVIASVLLLVISFLAIQRNRLRTKVNQLLLKQNKELTELNERTKKSEQELINLNLTKDKFFSIIAHDLRSPIASLIGFLNLLEANSSTFTQDELILFCKQMKDSVQNLNDLMNNLLQWALTQSGAIECKPKLFSLNEIIEKNKALFTPALMEKNISLQYNPLKNDSIIADVNMIDFVIRNLIQNAIKFTKPGGIIIVKQEYKNGLLNLYIEDNGIGIAEENLPNLFRIDYKNKQTGTANEKGTGLGLILSREFMERNGGYISARSVYGEGTTFTLSFVSNN